MNNFDSLTYKINGCAMKVHNTLGNGFQEVIYQRCLAIELERAGLNFAREVEQDIFYEGIHVGTRRADFVVENDIIVELKALINLEDVHLAQAKNYLVAYDKPIGLLINFGATSLQFKKVFNSKHRQHQDLQDLKMSRMATDEKSGNSQNPGRPDPDNNPVNPKIP
ncbi:MAG: GxxExxY protein [Saprospiraceae bacterium]|nr:GxxExxY protein [Saprospiraceae bacterium]